MPVNFVTEVDYPFLDYMYMPNVAPLQPINRKTTCPQTQCTVLKPGCNS